MDPEIAAHELALLRPEILWTDIEFALSIYYQNIGELLPWGHTWGELALEIHRGSEDRLFLLSILIDITEKGTDGEWIQKAMPILKDWAH